MPSHAAHNVDATDDLAGQFKRFHQRISSLERISSSGMNHIVMVGSSAMIADQTGIANVDTVLTGSSVTFNAVALRRYRLDWTFPCTQVTATGRQTIQVRVGGIVLAVLEIEDCVVGTRMASGFLDLGVLGTGSKTVDLVGRTNGGTLAINGASLVNGRVMLMNIGT